MKMVFPRDAFNAANYFKCIGKLFVTQLDCENNWWCIKSMNGDTFDKMPEPIIDGDDGSLYCPDIWLEQTTTGERFALKVPMNSREPWPMIAENETTVFYMSDLTPSIEDSIAIVWQVDDVQQERKHLTVEQAREVLKRAQSNHDANFGISWETLQCIADDMFTAA